MKSLLSFTRKIRVFTFVAIIMLISASIPLGHPEKAYSAPLTIANFNFESPSNIDLSLNTGTVTGWVKSGAGSYGTYNPTPIGGWWYTSSDFIDSGVTGGESGTMDGPNAAFFWMSPGVNLTQTLTDTLQVGTQYTLTASVGVRDMGEIYSGYLIELLSGGNVLASLSGNNTPIYGSFGDVSLTYIATNLDPSGNIGIRLKQGSSGQYTDYDNIRLDASPLNNNVPEPGTLLLLGSGITGLLIYRKKQIL